MSPYLEDPATVAMQASIELLAQSIYQEEIQDQRFSKPERPPRWIELTKEDRDEYRKVATTLIAKEYK